MLVIIDGVASNRDKSKDEKHRLAPTPGWLRMLRLHWVRLQRGEKGLVLESAALPRQTANLITKQVEDAKPGETQVSFDTYERMRLALNGHRYDDGGKAPDLPPPFIAITDAKEWEWIEAGRRLRAAKPDEWLQRVESVRKMADAAEMSREASEEFSAALRPSGRS